MTRYIEPINLPEELTLSKKMQTYIESGNTSIKELNKFLNDYNNDAEFVRDNQEEKDELDNQYAHTINPLCISINNQINTIQKLAANDSSLPDAVKSQMNSIKKELIDIINEL